MIVSKNVKLVYNATRFDIKKWILLILALILNVIVQVLLEYITDSFGVFYDPDSVLIDLGFVLIPRIENTIVINIILYLPKVVFVLTIIVLLIMRAMVVVNLMLDMSAQIFILRALAITITLLPNPYKSCFFDTSQQVGRSKVVSFLYDSLRVFVGITETCKDAFFSGHTSMYAVCVIIILITIISRAKYKTTQSKNPQKMYIQGISNILFSIEFYVCYYALITIYAVFVIAIRLHYSIDVSIGAIIPILSLYLLTNVIIYLNPAYLKS